MQVAPKGAPGAPPSAQQGGQDASGAAAQAIQMIQQGFQVLGKVMQSAGQNLPPEDQKLFQQAAMAADAFIQSITGPGGQDSGPPQRQAPGGPMPANANAGAKQAM